jgi:hypothetical protein
MSRGGVFERRLLGHGNENKNKTSLSNIKNKNKLMIR